MINASRFRYVNQNSMWRPLPKKLLPPQTQTLSMRLGAWKPLDDLAVQYTEGRASRRCYSTVCVVRRKQVRWVWKWRVSAQSWHSNQTLLSTLFSSRESLTCCLIIMHEEMATSLSLESQTSLVSSSLHPPAGIRNTNQHHPIWTEVPISVLE